MTAPGRPAAETVAFLSAMALLAALFGWWSVFALRLIARVEELERGSASALGTAGADVATRLAAVSDRALARTWMIATEGAAIALLLLGSVAILFVVARQRRVAREGLERLLQSTSHELKTPLAALRALLQSLRLGSIPSARRGTLLTRGLAECDRLDRLVRTILAYQAVSAAPNPRFVRFDPSDLVHAVLSERRRAFGTERIVRPVPARCEVFGDPEGLRVVLENLLDNAKKYGGGSIVVRERLSGGRWTLAVQDDGVGFEPHERDALFEPFLRGRQASGRGTGLGLHLASRLAHEMGARLVAESPGVGSGATFSIELRALEVGSPHG